jgi:hypothetical protein
MKYDPNNELTEEQLNKLGEDDFDAFLDYLDQKAEHLKQFTKPLGEYHTKRYAAVSAAHQGKQLTEKEFQSAKKIGKEGDMINHQRIIDKMKEKDMKEPDKHVKNIKTHRSQWFD